MRLKRVRIARRKVRRVGLRHKTAVGVIGGVLAVIPAGAMTDGTVDWAKSHPTTQTRDAALVEGMNPQLLQVDVDGSLPKPAAVQRPLPVDQLPSGPLGIPGSALRAYHNAADLVTRQQPNCHIDWALIASVGRIESNHARGGYVDKNGTSIEPILGPELNGTGGVAAIPDTDGGRWDHDTVWDRAVGPTQFIPSTWNFYGADGNGDGAADPNNIYDSTLATARYLCSGGLDLTNPAQLRAAIYRYNSSDVYVDTVILWAEAYRKGVAPLPDSKVPIGAPAPAPLSTAPAPPPPPPPAPTTVAPPAPTNAPAQAVTSPPPSGTSAPRITSNAPAGPPLPSSSAPGGPPPSGTPGGPPPSGTPGSSPPTTTTTSPTCVPTSTSPTSTTVTTTPPASPGPCAPPTTTTTTDTRIRPTS